METCLRNTYEKFRFNYYNAQQTRSFVNNLMLNACESTTVLTLTTANTSTTNERKQPNKPTQKSSLSPNQYFLAHALTHLPGATSVH